MAGFSLQAAILETSVMNLSEVTHTTNMVSVSSLVTCVYFDRFIKSMSNGNSPVHAYNCRCCYFPIALCCSLYEGNCVCAVTKFFTKFLPANSFCQLLRVTRKRSCTSASNTQAQLHFRDDQQRTFGVSNISNFTCAHKEIVLVAATVILPRRYEKIT